MHIGVCAFKAFKNFYKRKHLEKKKEKSYLALKINKANSSETGEEPSCGKEMRRTAGSGVPETQSSALPSGNSLGTDPWRAQPCDASRHSRPWVIFWGLLHP